AVEADGRDVIDGAVAVDVRVHGESALVLPGDGLHEPVAVEIRLGRAEVEHPAAHRDAQAQRAGAGERRAVEPADVRAGPVSGGVGTEEGGVQGAGRPAEAVVAGVGWPGGAGGRTDERAGGVLPASRRRRMRRSRSATRGPGSWAKPSVIVDSAARIREPSDCSTSARSPASRSVTTAIEWVRSACVRRTVTVTQPSVRPHRRASGTRTAAIPGIS